MPLQSLQVFRTNARRIDEWTCEILPKLFDLLCKKSQATNWGVQVRPSGICFRDSPFQIFEGPFSKSMNDSKHVTSSSLLTFSIVG